MEPHPVNYANAGQPDVPNYLWQSIVVTILCCLPPGIPAIVYATKVNTLLMQNNVPGAQAASKSAKTWCWVAFWLGLGSILVMILLQLAAFGLFARHPMVKQPVVDFSPASAIRPVPPVQYTMPSGIVEERIGRMNEMPQNPVRRPTMPTGMVEHP